MLFSQDKHSKVTAEDLEIVTQAMKNGTFIVLDLFWYALFFGLMFYLVPAPIYIFSTILFTIYIVICLLFYLQNKKTERKHS